MFFLPANIRNYFECAKADGGFFLWLCKKLCGVRHTADVGAGPVPARMPDRAFIRRRPPCTLAPMGHRAGTGPAPTLAVSPTRNFAAPLFVKERRQGRCPATDSLEWRGFEILILRRTELFVLNEVQALIAVEGELGVIGDERDAVADGLRNDQVVTGVIVLLCLIDLQSGILLVMLLVEVEDSAITLGERFSRSFAYHT